MKKITTIKDKSNSIFNYAFFILFSFIVICASNEIFKDLFVVTFTAFAIAIIFFIGLYINKSDKTLSSKKVNIIFIFIFSIMVILLIVIGYNLLCIPVTDWYVIDLFSRNFAESGSFENMYEGLPKGNYGYIARYPNNNGILMLLSFYDRFIYLLLGYVPLYAPVALNTLFIAIAVLFTFLTAKKIFSPLGALITAVFCFLFLPYYTYTAYYYSDSLSIPFVTIAVYFLVLGAKSTEHKLIKRLLCLVISAVSIAIGYSIKGSILVILVAAVVYIALENKLKQALIGILCIVLAFGMTSIGIKEFGKSLNFTTEEELYEEQYPITHWIMMGLRDKGGFNQEDSSFTGNSGNYDEKKAAVNEEIKNRLKEMTPYTMAEHLSKKLSYTWGDGTYYISNHLNIYENIEEDLKTEYNPLYEYILSNGKYHNRFTLYSNTVHMTMLLFILFFAGYSIRRKKINEMTLIMGIVFGVAIFFMIWETRSRYIFNFTPMFILIASGGIEVFMRKAPKLLNWYKSHKNS